MYGLCRLLLCLGSVLLLGVGTALAAFPFGPVTIVVPFPPGGSSDVLARKIADKIDAAIDYPVVVENRPGAGGLIGSRRVADASADGHTLVLGVTGSHAISHSLYEVPPYDPVTDFRAVSLVVSAPLVVAVNAEVPVETLDDFLAYARQHPGGLVYSTPGIGTSMHLTGEMFNLWADTDIVHAPYQGSGAAVNDFLAGRVEVMFGDVLVLRPHIESGRVKALAMTSQERHPMFPEVPALAERPDFEGFEALSWQGLFVPAGTPDETVQALNELVTTALADEELQAFFNAQGLLIKGSSAEGFQQFVGAEKEKWAEIVEQANIPLN